MSASISKTMFVAGIIIAILASSLVASVVSMQWARGPKGDKGDTGDTGAQGTQGLRGVQGPQGPQGLQGIQGPPGRNGTNGMNGTLSPWMLPVPAYDTGWVSVGDYNGSNIFYHGLNTTDVLVYIYRNCSSYGVHASLPDYHVFWQNLTTTTISVYVDSIPNVQYDYIRLMMWKIPPP